MRLYVTFLAEAPSPAARKKLEALDGGPDRLRCVGDTVYLHCPDGYGKSALSNDVVEKTLAVAATTRNWRTVNALAELAGA